MPEAAPLGSLHRLVWTALLAALVAVGSYLYFPIGPVPISLQTFFVLLTGFVLGPSSGAICIGLYLAAGLLGLPVFTGGGTGLAKLFGPTGGFLFGFVPASIMAGLATRRDREQLSWGRGLLWGSIGLACMYALGLIWLKILLKAGWIKVLSVGLLPFLPGEAAKLPLAVAAYRFLRQRGLLPS
ncbi:MAG: biotin transporter BioY [Proteobacteria bacterium]|nr:biotin transporter BioY [Pseudomonadota bacterium]